MTVAQYLSIPPLKLQAPFSRTFEPRTLRLGLKVWFGFCKGSGNKKVISGFQALRQARCDDRARTCERKAPTVLRAGSLSSMLPTPPGLKEV
ncbi:hypothetical protein PoB_007040900 [Plakobranchus ocellatus]|uniref:Uncharacterized protein n=1 Tax=Plakobranchus ocellatus TaxID=259542 RepID=A0AAV4DIQ3_9GAST|nr:hypothetical protein PoB_007040900 [Plakobranchus ocellatus]